MPSRPKDELKAIRNGFMGRKRAMPELQGQAESDFPQAEGEDELPKKKYNSFGAEMEDEESPLPENAPLKDRVTRSILSILRKKGPPKAE